MGDLIDEYQGREVHQNVKFSTLLQDQGDSRQHDEASQSGLYQDRYLSREASVFRLIHNQPLFHGCDNDQNDQTTRASSSEIVIASDLSASKFVRIEVEMRKSYSDQVYSHNDLVCEERLNQQGQQRKQSDVKLTPWVAFETLLVVEPNENIHDVHV